MPGSKSRVLSVVMVVGVLVGALGAGLSPASAARQDVAQDLHCEPRGCVDAWDLAQSSVNSAKIEDGTVTLDDLAFDPSQASDLECEGCVDSGDVQNGSIQQEDLAFTPGTATDLACDACVDTADLRDNGVTSAKVAQGTIAGERVPDLPSWDTAGDIGLRTITWQNIAESTITADELAIGSVESSEIRDGNVHTVDLAGTYDRFASFAETVIGAVTGEKIADGTIETRDIRPGAVTSETMLDGTINSQDITAGAVTTRNMTANAALGTGAEQASAIVAVPSGDDHFVQLSGQMQISCSCDGTDSFSNWVEWRITRQVGAAPPQPISPVYTEDLDTTDRRVVASISFLDVAAPAGQTVTYSLVANDAPHATGTSFDASFSNTILTAVDLGEGS